MDESYYIFAGQNFYSLGGWLDYIGETNTIEQAMALMENGETDFLWMHIVNPNNKQIVKFGRRDSVVNAEETEFCLTEWIWSDEQ